MSLTIGEANALNNVLHHLANESAHGIPVPSRGRVEEDLRKLLASSHKTLMAGYTEDDAPRLLERIRR